MKHEVPFWCVIVCANVYFASEKTMTGVVWLLFAAMIMYFSWSKK